ncbi:SPRY-domain-containing protein [Gigaspora margarita]|uniref:SPRY-domain-containing protein n=1 Tax=Gigaspora margarita TaxID=4874 RepID=A0A8H3WXU1_GIGMA|nr:SPRY-domain-containing protein [Gigaspora margarita]
MAPPRDFIPSYLRDSPIFLLNKRSVTSIPLPTRWNSHDRAPYVSVLEDGVSLEYIGPGRNWIDASSIRTDFPVLPEVGLYYFEIKVIDKGERGCIGIGLTKGHIPLDRMPGWEQESIGYHGDDGLLYLQSGRGDKYGPLYTTGDTVGCGINYYDKSIFFTKNGVNLGVASKAIFEGEMYPIGGMISPNERIEANFGEKPFKYDIDTYAKYVFTQAAANKIKEEKAKLSEQTFGIIEIVSREHVEDNEQIISSEQADSTGQSR